jgi:hypothetical protein
MRNRKSPIRIGTRDESSLLGHNAVWEQTTPRFAGRTTLTMYAKTWSKISITVYHPIRCHMPETWIFTNTFSNLKPCIRPTGLCASSLIPNRELLKGISWNVTLASYTKNYRYILILFKIGPNRGPSLENYKRFCPHLGRNSLHMYRSKQHFQQKV